MYILLVDDVSWLPVAVKWARVNRPMPSNTIGVPSNEQISSPVTLGDHRIVAANTENNKKEENDLVEYIFWLLQWEIGKEHLTKL